MSAPLVSIITPAFNRPDFLVKTLESIFAQDYPAKEVIVVDDGSTEGVEKIREVCGAWPVRYIRQENRGPSAAYNSGAASSRGELLAFLDDDDLWAPGSLRLRVEHWQGEPESHHVVGRTRRFRENPDGGIEFIDSEEQARHIIGVGMEVMLKTAFEQLGGFDESLRMSEDVDLWMRMRAAGLRQKYIPEICLFNRQHAGKLTREDESKTRRGFLNALRLGMRRAKPRGECPANKP
jgi:glycosyltransferase involved in cell wall biosynthesis